VGTCGEHAGHLTGMFVFHHVRLINGQASFHRHAVVLRQTHMHMKLASLLADQFHGPNGSTFMRAVHHKQRITWAHVDRRDWIRMHDHLCRYAMLSNWDDMPDIIEDMYAIRRMLRLVVEPFPGHDAELSKWGMRLDEWLTVVAPHMREPLLDMSVNDSK
jgi:hypothetical protein